MRTLPHDKFVQARAAATMIDGGAGRHQRAKSRQSFPPANAIRQSRGYSADRSSEEQADYAIQEVHDRMVKLLPRLRRFMQSRARGLDSSEDLVQETYVRALTHLDQWKPGTRLDSWMFRIAQNLWIDHMRRGPFPRACGRYSARRPLAGLRRSKRRRK